MEDFCKMKTEGKLGSLGRLGRLEKIERLVLSRISLNSLTSLKSLTQQDESLARYGDILGLDKEIDSDG